MVSRAEGVPESVVADLVARAQATGRPHIGVRPVTDTVKVLHDGLVGETLDRSDLWQIVGPVVAPAGSLSDPVYVEAAPLPRPHPPGT